MKKLLSVALTLTGLLSPFTLALAQSTASRLEEIVVVANRAPVPLREIATSVSSLNQAEINSHGNFALTDVLRQLPAIATSNAGGAGQPTSLRIRGEEGFRTLTLIDGIRVSDPSTPQISPQFDQILSNQISRVEILRGPQGLSYGADAGGVVSIHSSAPQSGLQATFDIQSGSRDSKQLGAALSGADERVDYAIALTSFETAGLNSRVSDSLLADRDAYDNDTAHGRIGFKLNEQLRLTAVHRQVEASSEYDGCYAGTTVHDCLADYEMQASRIALDYSGATVTHSLAWSGTQTNRQNYALGKPAFAAKGELQRWEYLGSVNNLSAVDLLFGADQEKAESGHSSRNNTGYFVEVLSDFSEQLYLSAGVRHDDNDDFGGNNSYRLSAAYLVDIGSDATLKLRSSYGSGFRAPSPFEVEYNSGPYAYAPAAQVTLAQETSEGFEIGMLYLSNRNWQAELVYFDQQIEDAIYFDLARYSGYLQERGNSLSKGVEFSSSLSVTEQVELFGNVTYNDTERSDGRQRIRRPQQLGNVGLAYNNSNDRLHLAAYYRISRNAIDEVFGTVQALDDFAVLDLSVSYQLNKRTTLIARLENALDEHYAEITDYRTPGRSSFIGLRLGF